MKPHVLLIEPMMPEVEAQLDATYCVHLVVRYSKNGLAEQGADLPGELPQLSGWSCRANGSRKGCSQG